MKVIIIGGGAAGMMAAYQAAKCGNDVSLYEKNEKLGKKIFITGKGRCNVTNACEIEELLDHVVTNKEFLYSGFYSFTNDATTTLSAFTVSPDANLTPVTNPSSIRIFLTVVLKYMSTFSFLRPLCNAAITSEE